MKRKGIRPARVLAAVLCLFSLWFPAAAGSERLSDHFSVRYMRSGVSFPLDVALAYSNEGGILADGVLVFVPLADFIRWEYDPPVVTAAGEPLYRVDYDDGFFDAFTVSESFYEPTEDSFVRIRREDGAPVALEDLQNIHAEIGKEYFSGAGFLHINVPGGGGSVWPVPTETPTVRPTPTPGPTPKPGLP